MLISLSSLRDELRNRGEFRAPRFPDATLNTWINSALRQLHALLAELDEDRFLSTANISVVAGTANYALPSGHADTKALWINDGGVPYHFQRVDWRERLDLGLNRASSATECSYALNGGYIYFAPTPGWSGTVVHEYIGEPTALSLDVDTYDFPKGSENWLLHQACITAGLRNDQQVNEWRQARNEVEAFLRTHCRRRDKASPPMISRTPGRYVRRRNTWDRFPE